MDEPIQMDIKVEEEQILCQYDQQNMITYSNIQFERAFEVKKQGTKDGSKDFESISALSTNYWDMDSDDFDDNDEEHECTLCVRLFQSEKLFKAHLKEHAKLDGLLSDSGGEEEFQTIKDPETKNADHQSIPSKKTKIAHVHTNDEESPYKCSHCPKKYAMKRQLQRHMNRHGRPYKCAICSKSFPYPSHLEDHMHVHSSERPYKCDLCSKAFKTTGELKRHKRTHSEEHPFTCETCSKSFYTTSALKVHMRIHTGERPYKCEICSKTFKSTSEFKRHMIFHTGDHPYQCEICSKKCLDSNSYKIHMRIHTGDRPYKCEICSKTYKCASAMKVHKRTHDARPFQCNQCPRHFPTKEKREKHAFLKHNIGLRAKRKNSGTNLIDKKSI